MEEKTYTISVYTENNIGLLNRISAIFLKRHINSDSFSTSESEIKNVFRFVIVVKMTSDKVVKIVKQIEKFIDDGYSVVLWPEYVKEKDINEMVLSGRTDTEIKTIINENVYSGIQAKTQFVFWKKVELKNEKNLSRNQYRHR